MRDVNREKIARLAASARRALELNAQGAGGLFQGFPKGACGPAAELVGRVLAERLGLESVYVCCEDHPELAPSQSHAWTEVGPLLIDLTHDQFPDTGLVGWVHSSKSAWHSMFREQERRAGYCMPTNWPTYPHAAYRAILEQLGR